MNYQIRKGNLSEEEFNNRTAVLYKNIDQTTEDMENWDLNYHYAYYRMDLRKYSEKTEITEKDGQKYIGLKVHMPEELEKFSKRERTVLSGQAYRIGGMVFCTISKENERLQEIYKI